MRLNVFLTDLFKGYDSPANLQTLFRYIKRMNWCTTNNALTIFSLIPDDFQWVVWKFYFVEHSFVYFSWFIFDCQIKIIHLSLWVADPITSDMKAYTRDQMRLVDWFMKK